MAMPPVIPNTDKLDGTETMLVRQGGLLRRITLTLLKAFVQPAPTSFYVADVVVSEKMALGVAASTRAVPVACPGVKKGSSVLFCPIAALPTGFGIGVPTAPADDIINVPVAIPALSLGATYSISGKVYVLK